MLTNYWDQTSGNDFKIAPSSSFSLIIFSVHKLVRKTTVILLRSTVRSLLACRYADPHFPGLCSIKRHFFSCVGDFSSNVKALRHLYYTMCSMPWSMPSNWIVSSKLNQSVPVQCALLYANATDFTANSHGKGSLIHSRTAHRTSVGVLMASIYPSFTTKRVIENFRIIRRTKKSKFERETTRFFGPCGEHPKRLTTHLLSALLSIGSSSPVVDVRAVWSFLWSWPRLFLWLGELVSGREHQPLVDGVVGLTQPLHNHIHLHTAPGVETVQRPDPFLTHSCRWKIIPLIKPTRWHEHDPVETCPWKTFGN